MVEGPPGIHGVILEIDLAKAGSSEEVTTQECLRFYSLKVVQETVQELVTPTQSVHSEHS